MNIINFEEGCEKHNFSCPYTLFCLYTTICHHSNAKTIWQQNMLKHVLLSNCFCTYTTNRFFTYTTCMWHSLYIHVYYTPLKRLNPLHSNVYCCSTPNQCFFKKIEAVLMAGMEPQPLINSPYIVLNLYKFLV